MDYFGSWGVDMIIPCNVSGFRKAKIADCCVFRSYHDLQRGRELATRYGLLYKTLDTHSTTPGQAYGFEVVFVPDVVADRYSRAGKTKFDPATVEKMRKVLNRG